MTSRERLIKALNHIETDRPPIDLGATNTTGISALSLHHLREKLGLKGKVRIAEPFQILGEVDDEVRKALGVDVVGIFDRNTFFGYQNGTGWKDWNFKGVDMLIGEGFITTTNEKGDTFVSVSYTHLRSCPAMI